MRKIAESWVRHASVATVAIIAVVALGTMPSLIAPAQAATTSARALLDKLPVKAESNTGYDRDDFKHWIDANKDCKDTRETVLINESKAQVNGTCTFTKGKWVSTFDGKTYYYKSQVDVDHHVALAEAWGSGAKSWSESRRTAFANDLYGPSLNAMTPDMNRYKKVAKDPAEWLPPKNRCTYAIWWVQVKYRWKLSVDSAEKSALSQVLSGSCGSRTVTIPTRP